ncbi:MAG: HPr family phosphocarrier protein [Elusimicrobia bacterium CG06_land_8_20_14_3_00_38_11]|nr:MAG: HPr family phosphocarrier protein [Elusimicrobia bacterium CG06_land_8_20_14_3_00_38_11]
MIRKTVKIKNKLGLHARPASLFVQTTSKFKSEIKVLKDEQEVDGKSIMGLMMLAAGNGTELQILIDGIDENELITAIENLIERKFDEE